MDRDALCLALKQHYPSLPPQERAAAGFILEHAQEVAVLSMRDLARMTGVPPSTMTRLAKRIGLSGYDALKAAFVEAVRAQSHAYGSRAQEMVRLHQRIGDEARIQDLAADAIANIRAACNAENTAVMVRAARRLAKARRVYCLGLRSSFAVAFQFAHVASYFAKDVALIDAAGESGVMSLLHQTTPNDIALVCSLPRYSRKAIGITDFLHRQGVPIIAITDSPTSPVGRLATDTILVPNHTSSFFDTIVPALLVSEILVALLSTAMPGNVEAQVAEAEGKLMGLGEWWELG